MNSLEERIEELKQLAAEEDEEIIPSLESEKDLIEFVKSSNFQKRPYITLSDNGIYRAHWKNDCCKISLAFLGNNAVQYGIIDSVTRSYGKGTAENFKGYINYKMKGNGY